MISEPQYPQKMTAEAYLEWEATQQLRHEYVDGEILAMTGGSIPHNDIALNLYTALRPHLRQRGCRVNVSDVKVQTHQNSRYFYPDLVITCDPEDLKSRKFIQNPKVIVEVLSPSTASYDCTKKLKYYRQISSLQEYMLIDSESISVEVYHRAEGKMWYYYGYENGDVIALKSIEFECPMELLYEGINFDQA
ncbi:Uma2 family endonuclease [Planktothrix mougeotii]|uniref:Uma2 family endonuclease n=1 Tax=Planktothrix mougeotii LEGE 06226 TaxID=1828728 RepID=A0ABR9U9D4_9CYAN|nr:Uma2 family endonuclease [Planktothrix mougeotii]MBE9143061.1 Uma2 family endonuclease [Planktothrix mougeotii LEGE 06226]